MTKMGGDLEEFAKRYPEIIGPTPDALEEFAEWLKDELNEKDNKETSNDHAT